MKGAREESEAASAGWQSEMAAGLEAASRAAEELLERLAAGVSEAVSKAERDGFAEGARRAHVEELERRCAELAKGKEEHGEEARRAAEEAAGLRAEASRLEEGFRELVESSRAVIRSQCEGLDGACVELDGRVRSMEDFVRTILSRTEQELAEMKGARAASDLASEGWQLEVAAGLESASRAAEELLERLVQAYLSRARSHAQQAGRDSVKALLRLC